MEIMIEEDYKFLPFDWIKPHWAIARLVSSLFKGKSKTRSMKQKIFKNTLPFENCTILLEVGRKLETLSSFARTLFIVLLFKCLSALASFTQESILPAYKSMPELPK